MKRSKNLLAVLLLSGAVLLSSCIGSFRLTRNVYEWNQTVGDKFVNELVFLVFCVVPVYEFAVFIDAVVLNSVEFWSGENPMDSASTATVKGKNGEYLVERHATGYTITDTDTRQVVELRFDTASRSWSAVGGGRSVKLFSFLDNDRVMMYLPDGTTAEAELSEAGVLAFRHCVDAAAPMFAAH